MVMRKDYFLDRWVIYAPERAGRPQQLKEHKQKSPADCVFCAGNEHRAHEEIGRVEEKGKWVARWVANKYPILNHGRHEIVIEDRGPKQLWDLDADRIKLILRIYSERVGSMEQDSGVKYVSVFKNHGKQAG